LDHGTAGLVTRRAADAAAIFGILALALAARKVALAALDAVPGAATAAQPVCQHATKVLQRAPGNFVVAAAMDLAAARRLLEFNCAAW
jgi:hypothetical protein